MMITGVFDGVKNSHWPKVVELYALKDIPDLRKYGFDVAHNGTGSTQPWTSNLLDQTKLL